MKKLSRSLAARSVFFMLAVCLSSCKQDVSVQPNPSVSQVQNDKIVDLKIEGVIVKDGLLEFVDYDAMAKAKESLIKANFESYKAYCQKIGFKSLALF